MRCTVVCRLECHIALCLKSWSSWPVRHLAWIPPWGDRIHLNTFWWWIVTLMRQCTHWSWATPLALWHTKLPLGSTLLSLSIFFSTSPKRHNISLFILIFYFGILALSLSCFPSFGVYSPLSEATWSCRVQLPSLSSRCLQTSWTESIFLDSDSERHGFLWLLIHVPSPGRV